MLFKQNILFEQSQHEPTRMLRAQHSFLVFSGYEHKRSKTTSPL